MYANLPLYSDELIHSCILMNQMNYNNGLILQMNYLHYSYHSLI
jgi:flagellar biosynthesis/type III secretory pathway chaperone